MLDKKKCTKSGSHAPWYRYLHSTRIWKLAAGVVLIVGGGYHRLNYNNVPVPHVSSTITYDLAVPPPSK